MTILTWPKAIATLVAICFLGAAGYWGGAPAVVTGVVMWLVGIVHALVILREEELDHRRGQNNHIDHLW